MTERQDERDTAQDLRGAKQDERELTQGEWIAEQKALIAQQTENITQLVGAVDSLATGLAKRPTLGRVLAIVATMSILTNIITVGFVVWSRNDVKEGQRDSLSVITGKQNASAKRGKDILKLTNRLDDCLDTTTDDGDPIGKCAAESQIRQALAIATVTKDVTCAEEKLFIEFLTLNPELKIAVPSPRPECDAEGN